MSQCTPSTSVIKKYNEISSAIKKELDVIAYICNLSTWEAEAGWSCIQGQTKLHSESLFQKPRYGFEI
jgi:hypothetical protein